MLEQVHPDLLRASAGQLLSHQELRIPAYTVNIHKQHKSGLLLAFSCFACTTSEGALAWGKLRGC